MMVPLSEENAHQSLKPKPHGAILTFNSTEEAAVRAVAITRNASAAVKEVNDDRWTCFSQIGWCDLVK